MIRVLVMAESLQLTDAIVSNLAQETNLHLYRVTQPAPVRSLQANCQRLPLFPQDHVIAAPITLPHR